MPRPAGEGSTFAPALIKSLKTMPYSEFKKIVTNGRKKERSVMPAFAGNRNVMCYVDDIYTYLKARYDGGTRAGASTRPR